MDVTALYLFATSADAQKQKHNGGVVLLTPDVRTTSADSAISLGRPSARSVWAYIPIESLDAGNLDLRRTQGSDPIKLIINEVIR